MNFIFFIKFKSNGFWVVQSTSKKVLILLSVDKMLVLFRNYLFSFMILTSLIISRKKNND